MTVKSSIYLDNAATSFPKPPSVYDAIDAYNRNLGVAVGRSGYSHALDLHRTVDRCRKQAAELLGAEEPDRIAFTFNCTDSLNLAIHGLLNSNDHVIVSSVEHNSVLRPLRSLQDWSNVDVTLVPPGETGRVEPAAFRKAIQANTRLIALTHASNVTGTLQPIADVGQIAREAGVPFLVDAAQTAGHTPIDLTTLPIDLLACAGHKGLLGPLGTGLLYLRPGMEEHVTSLRQGGTGSRSEDYHQPDQLPDKYESGNHNAPGLVGLQAALDWIGQQSVETIEAQSRELTAQLIDGLRGIDAIHLHGSGGNDGRVNVVSITVDGFDPQDLAAVLDDSFGIQTRAGLHCAPGAHKALGTFGLGGTVRISTGPFTTPDDVEQCVTALADITG